MSTPLPSYNKVYSFIHSFILFAHITVSLFAHVTVSLFAHVTVSLFAHVTVSLFAVHGEGGDNVKLTAVVTQRLRKAGRGAYVTTAMTTMNLSQTACTTRRGRKSRRSSCR